MSDSVDDLFKRYGPAYRWLVIFTGMTGVIAMVLSATIANVAVPSVMGAFGVGRIGNVFDEQITNTGKKVHSQQLEPAPSVERGGEMGRFELGSTVILLTEPGRVTWEMELGQVLRLGRRIASVKTV